MKRVMLLVILMLFSSGTAGAEPAENVSALVAAALKSNPELKSSEARWQTFVQKARQAGSLDDPMLMLKLQNMVNRYPLAFNRDSNTSRVIGLSQQIPFWGKRALKEEIAGHEAETYRWQLAERKLELVRMVKETYYQAYVVDKSLEVVARNLRIVDDLQKVTEIRYGVGQGAQTDIIRAGVEKSRLLEMQINLQQQRRSLSANMDYLLGRYQGTGYGPIPDFELPEVIRFPADLHEKAAVNRPLLKSLQSQRRKGESAQVLARRETYPDFNLGLEYMQREPAMGDPGYDMYSLSLTFNLPLQQERREAMLAEARSESLLADEEINALQSNIGFAIDDNMAQLERRRKLVELYRGGLIPQAEQSLESALIGYRAGKVDFLTLLDSRAALFSLERDLYESKAEYMMAMARLEAAVGSDVTVKNEK